MNNREFIAELSRRMDVSEEETSKAVDNLLELLTEQLEEGNAVSLPGFGSFEVKKKLERISVHPVSKQRMLVPPKLAVAFKPSSALKDKIN